MELKVDQEKCIGCGACVASFPENFDFEGAQSKVISNENATEDMATVCPVGAITLEGETEAPAADDQMAA